MFNICGYSTALFSTWFMVEELGLLLDCGDGAAAGLMQKARKAKHVFVSHADRDHLAGLVQFLQLNARDGLPDVYYPRDCGSFPALRDFLGRFDPHYQEARWRGLTDGQEVAISRDHVVLARRNGHVEPADQDKSFEFLVVERKRKLRPELRGLAGDEIAKIRTSGGEDAVSEEVRTPVLGYSGDSPALDPERWAGVRVLIHEATFLEPGEARRGHSSLAQVVAAAAEVGPERLVLSHFSSRYARDQIIEAVRQACAREQISFPVHAVLPGLIHRDLLAGDPLWPGRE